MVRLQIRRENSSSPRVVKLGWLSVKAPHARYYSHKNEDYIVFEPWSPGWESSLPLRCDGDGLHRRRDHLRRHSSKRQHFDCRRYNGGGQPRTDGLFCGIGAKRRLR